MLRSVYVGLVLATTISLSACDNEPLGTSTRPQLSEIAIALNTPAVSDAAVVFSIVGTDTAAVVSSPYPWVFLSKESDVVRIAVIGALADGPLVRLAVPTAAVATIEPRLDEVADASNELRSDLASYSLTVVAGE